MPDGSRVSDQFETPRFIFDPLNEKFRFECDLSASIRNALCVNYFSWQNNALTRAWHKREGWLWNNPPYSRGNLHAFTAKARDEVQLGAAIVQLVPATVDAAWFQDNVLFGHDIIEKNTVMHTVDRRLDGVELVMSGTGGYRCTVRFLRRRINFANPHMPTAGQTAKTGSALIIWTPRRLL